MRVVHSSLWQSISQLPGKPTASPSQPRGVGQSERLTSDSREMSSILREGLEDDAPGPLRPKLLPLPFDTELPVNVSEEAALQCSRCRLKPDAGDDLKTTLCTATPLRLQHAGPAWFCCRAVLWKDVLCR